MSEKLRIKFGVPHYWPRHLGGVERGVEDFIGRLYQSKKYEIVPKQNQGNGMQGTVLGNLRNHLIAMCQKKRQTEFDFDYFLTMDADTWWPGDPDELLDRLIAHHVPVVSAAYPYRAGTGREDEYVAGYWLPDAPGAVAKSLHRTQRGLQQVDYVGGGCCLIAATVFRTLDYPWFRYIIVENGEDSEIASEDMGFALQCREKEIPIYVDCDVECTHLATYGQPPAQQNIKALQQAFAIHQTAQKAQKDLYAANMALSVAMGAYMAAADAEAQLVPKILRSLTQQGGAAK